MKYTIIFSLLLLSCGEQTSKSHPNVLVPACSDDIRHKLTEDFSLFSADSGRIWIVQGFANGPEKTLGVGGVDSVALFDKYILFHAPNPDMTSTNKDSWHLIDTLSNVHNFYLSREKFLRVANLPKDYSLVAINSFVR